MILDEALFMDETAPVEEWKEVATKQVMDSDGFMTDYTWYTNGDEHICIFGDKELYFPGDVTPDIDGFYGEEGAEAMAQWFNSSTVQNLLHPLLSIVAHSLLRYHHRCSVKDAVIWIASSADVSD